MKLGTGTQEHDRLGEQMDEQSTAGDTRIYTYNENQLDNKRCETIEGGKTTNDTEKRWIAKKEETAKKPYQLNKKKGV